MNISSPTPISENISPRFDINSLKINDFDDQEEIYEDLYQDLKETIYSTLDNRIPDDKKDELIDSLFALVIQDTKYDNQDCIQYPISYNFQSTNNQCFSGNFNPMFPLYNFSLPNFSLPQQLNPMQPILQYPPYVPPQVPNFPYQMPNPLLQSPQLPLQYPSPYYPYSNKIADDHSLEKGSKHKKHESHSKSKKSKDKKKHDKKNGKDKGKKDKKKGKKDEKDKNIQSFPYSGGADFNGIIRYLTNKTGGNIHNNSTIEITTNSNLSGRSTAPSLIDYDSRNDYMAQSGDFYAWICFDFKNMKIEVTNYTIKSSHCSIGHLRSWVLEVSNDNSNWKTIDEHKDDSSLNGPNIIQTFSTQKCNFSRYCRFRHTGEYWGYKPSGTSIEFNSLEFYGKLKTSS